MTEQSFTTLILGAGAAGLMCAAHSGPGTLVVDHAKAPGEKIRISGGGRCNFTNMYAGPENFLSQNPHFAKSALSRYTQWDFLDLVNKHAIAWHEKTLGQLFCDGSAKEIIAMLLAEMQPAQMWLRTEIGEIGHDGSRFRVVLIREGRNVTVSARNLVVATGGKSIPKMGATGIGYRIAEQFGHTLTDTRPGPSATDLQRGSEGRLPPPCRQRRAGGGRLQWRQLRRGDAVHPQGPVWPGDPANLLLLAGRGQPVAAALPRHRSVRCPARPASNRWGQGADHRSGRSSAARTVPVSGRKLGPGGQSCRPVGQGVAGACGSVGKLAADAHLFRGFTAPQRSRLAGWKPTGYLPKPWNRSCNRGFS